MNNNYGAQMYEEPDMKSEGRVPPSAVEVEEKILGGMMLDEEAMLGAFEILEAKDFYKPAHQTIFGTFFDLFMDDKPLEQTVIESKMKDDGSLDAVGGPGYIADLMRMASSAANIEYHANIVAEKSKKRQLIKTCSEVIDDAYDSSSDTMEVLEKAESKIFELAQDKGSEEAKHIGDHLQNVLEQYEALKEDPESGDGMMCGLDIDDKLTGFKPGNLYILAARPSMGKAQPLDAKIKTYTGWKKMGDIEVGDMLASVDGEPSFVEDVFPQGEKDIYEITFSDGRSTKATADHLWTVNNRKWKSKKTVTTEKLIEYLEMPSYQNRIWVDRVSGDFGHSNLPIDPWVLGILLGDGRVDNGIKLTTDDAQTLNVFTSRLPGYCKVNYGSKYTFRIVDTGPQKSNRLLEKLRDLGLGQSSSYTKFIPEQYLLANKEDRKLLLQGLMDSDGWCEKSGTLRYSTSSEQLSLDFQELVRSLGGLCEIAEKEPSYTYKEEKLQGEVSYVCKPRFDTPKDYVTTYKKKRRATNSRSVRLKISSIKHIGKEEAQCIKVTHPSQLYVTDDYVVTHNTALALRFAKGLANNGYSVGKFSLEMSGQSLTDRLVTMESKINGQRARKGEISDEEFQRMLDGAGRLYNQNIFVDDTPGISVMQMRSKARHMVQKQGCNIIFIDYLQLMTYSGNVGTREQEITKISQGLQAIARDLDVPVVALSQLSRAVEQRGGDKRPQLSDLRESGSIEQDADVVMFLYRPEYYGITSTPEGEPTKGLAEVLIKKQRNGPTGTTYLYFQEEYANFENQSYQHTEQFEDEEGAPF